MQRERIVQKHCCHNLGQSFEAEEFNWGREDWFFKEADAWCEAWRPRQCCPSLVRTCQREKVAGVNSHFERKAEKFVTAFSIEDFHCSFGIKDSIPDTPHNLFLMSSHPFIIRCNYYITPHYTIPTKLWHPLTHPNPFQWVTLYQFCITAKEDLWIETSCTLLKLMLCSKLTNLPFLEDFHCSNGWIDCFKQWHDLKFKTISGEKGEVSLELTSN